MPTVNVIMNRREWALLLLLALLWSGSFPFAKIAIGELPPLTVVLARVGFAVLDGRLPRWLAPRISC